MLVATKSCNPRLLACPHIAQSQQPCEFWSCCSASGLMLMQVEAVVAQPTAELVTCCLVRLTRPYGSFPHPQPG